MNKSNLIISGLAVGALFLTVNNSKASQTTPPITTPPVVSKEQLLKNYKSAMLNVFEEYDLQTKYTPNPTIIDKFTDKILQAAETQKTNPRPFTLLVESYPDISIPGTTFKAKFIVRDLENKIYNLY